GATKNYRLSGMVGARYRTTQYLLNSLDVQGQYRPAFTDVQGYLLYNIRDNWDIDFLANYAVNNYRVFPQTQTTEFGTINQALQLRVFFDGKDQSRFATGMGAVTSTWRPNSKLKLKLIASGFNSSETERSDVAGEYYIDELERDLGSDNFGDVAFNRGVGAYQTFLRNKLNYQVFNTEHKGYLEKDNQFIQWGFRAQQERIQDELKEWRQVDSAGYNIPLAPSDSIILDQVIRADTTFQSMRYQAYLQDNIHWRRDSVDYALTGGLRANYWTFNNQLVVSPRLVFSMSPLFWKRNITFRAAAGHYAQPPFYRELRRFDGSINPNLKAQDSYHFIAGADFTFKAWDRPFSFYAEGYYKILRNLVPYEIDNVRIRYYAENVSDGYAAGVDMKVNGEFVKGVQSWASLSVMKTEEDIRNDFYYDYFNAEGEKIIAGYTYDNVAVDSVRHEPGFVPRLTDQRVNFSLFFQDYLPKNESIAMQITLVFGTRLPIGPPDYNRYRDTLRIPAYRRVDMGVTKHFISADRRPKEGSFLSKLETLSLSLEIFNLLGINNTVSYIWIKDVTNRSYAVPNYLTNRLINLRMQVTF
ncbi:MAG: TonB-dependent receptor, partial [Bacteroidetes bacterium]|nr:TonB-dependent receptor [Bacteroidota bacterium]